MVAALEKRWNEYMRFYLSKGSYVRHLACTHLYGMILLLLYDATSVAMLSFRGNAGNVLDVPITLCLILNLTR